LVLKFLVPAVMFEHVEFLRQSQWGADGGMSVKTES
jgi:hypothetical protein